jgi:hypothetical protein
MLRMPETRSSAETNCISEVPGFMKQVSTPFANSVLSRHSAPFIIKPLGKPLPNSLP